MKRVIMTLDRIMVVNEYDNIVGNGMKMFITEKYKIKDDNILGYTFSNEFRLVPGVLTDLDNEKKYVGILVETPSEYFQKVYLRIINEKLSRIDIHREILFTDLFKKNKEVVFKQLPIKNK